MIAKRKFRTLVALGLLSWVNMFFVAEVSAQTTNRIEEWELLEEDFVVGITRNEAHEDHVREFDSIVTGRGWMYVNHTPAINDIYCPHPSPIACSERCDKYASLCEHEKLSACNLQCKSVEWRNWTYRAALFYDEEEAHREEHHFLEIKQWEGAYIEVFVNGKRVKSVNPLMSSFATVTIDLDPLIRRDGRDSVYIHFAAPTPLGKFYSQRLGWTFPADNEQEISVFGTYGYNAKNQTYAKASPFLRKPIVQYGWDIAPRRVLVGLGEGVFVHGWSDNHLQALNMTQDSSWMGMESGKAVEYVYGHADLYYLCDTQRGRPSFVRVISGNLPGLHDDIEWDIVRLQQTLEGSEEAEVEDVVLGANEFGVEARHRRMYFRMKNPKHWYPNGLYQQVYGDSSPALYHIEISAHQYDKNGRNQIHNIETNWGLRTIQLDTAGGRFAFSVNGISVFAQGANVIWAREFGGESVYPEQLFLGQPGSMGDLEIMRWQGYNMVRIWGGGAYPSDAFYDRCDALGIMVWQDLMFNGTTYPGDSMFKDAVTTEVNAQAMRLNNHPSLALWCGNNEIEVAWRNWGWQQKYHLHGQDSAQQWQAYLSLFDTLIPAALSNWNAGVPYTRSSPIGNWGNLHQMKRGDNHDWGIWHGERGFSHLDSARMPFCSEYGLPSPLDWALAQDGKENDWQSLLLSYKGPKLLEKYVHEEYPKTWPGQGSECLEVTNFGDSAAVVQGEFLYRAMISHRMASPFCMGSLFWQYNDIWNGTTWSVANSQHGWSMLKFSQGRVAEAMLPVVMRLQRSGWWGAKDQFYVQLNSRLLTDTEVKLMVTAYDSIGRALFKRNVKMRVPRNLNLSDGLMGGTRISPISFAHKGKFMKKMDRVSFYEVRMEQPAAAQRLLDLTPKGKHYGEGYPVLVEYLSVED